MIISHQHQIVFVHIPKCAGRYIRNSLASLDDTDGFFYLWRQMQNPEAEYIEYGSLQLNRCAKEKGYIDFAHMPLLMVAENFGNLFEKICQYRFFSIVRDPFARFPSSMEQRYKLFKKKRMAAVPNRELRKEITKTIEYLAQYPNSYAPEYIHFRPQADYVFLNGNQFVENLYVMDNASELLDDIGQIVGDNFVEKAKQKKFDKKYQAATYRNALLKNIASLTRPARKTLLGYSINQRLSRATRSYVYRPRREMHLKPFESDYVKDFIRWFYADDFVLYEHVKAAAK